MILPVAAALLVLSVPLTGGDLRYFGRIAVRGTPWIAACFLLQLIITTAPMLPFVGQVLHLASYALAAIFVWLNRQLPGLPALAGGGGMNLAAIAANGGTMPATPEALAVAGIAADGEHFVNSGVVEQARLWWLGDIFAVPASLPLANVFSLGDVVLLVGFGWLVHRVGRGVGTEPDTTGVVAGGTLWTSRQRPEVSRCRRTV